MFPSVWSEIPNNRLQRDMQPRNANEFKTVMSCPYQRHEIDLRCYILIMDKLGIICFVYISPLFKPTEFKHISFIPKGVIWTRDCVTYNTASLHGWVPKTWSSDWRFSSLKRRSFTPKPFECKMKSALHREMSIWTVHKES